MTGYEFTREELRTAFEDHARIHGRETALATLEKVTGTRLDIDSASLCSARALIPSLVISSASRSAKASPIRSRPGMHNTLSALVVLAAGPASLPISFESHSPYLPRAYRRNFSTFVAMMAGGASFKRETTTRRFIWPFENALRNLS